MIHRYINNGFHIVMDVNSGSVHVMDKSAYDAVPVVERLIDQGKEDKEEIARAVAQAHGGKITAQKREEGRILFRVVI